MSKYNNKAKNTQKKNTKREITNEKKIKKPQTIHKRNN